MEHIKSHSRKAFLLNKIIDEHHLRDCSDGYIINDRIAAVAKHVIAEYAGYIIEIGAGIGNTTEKLLKLGRKVIAIDPFEDGDYEGCESFSYPFDEFLSNCGNSSNLYLIKESSQNIKPGNILPPKEGIAFAFVDGLQVTVEDVYSDLVLMDSLETKVICVDDVYYITNHRPEVKDAVTKFLEKYNYVLVNLNEEYPSVRECYLIRTDK